MPIRNLQNLKGSLLDNYYGYMSPGFISGVEGVEGWSYKMAVGRPVAAIGRTGVGEADGGKSMS